MSWERLYGNAVRQDKSFKALYVTGEIVEKGEGSEEPSPKNETALKRFR